MSTIEEKLEQAYPPGALIVLRDNDEKLLVIRLILEHFIEDDLDLNGNYMMIRAIKFEYYKNNKSWSVLKEVVSSSLLHSICSHPELNWEIIKPNDVSRRT